MIVGFGAGRSSVKRAFLVAAHFRAAMARWRISLLSVFVLAFVMVWPQCAFSQSPEPRRFTVRDSIQLATFGERPEIVPSPDHRHLIVRTTAGRIESDQLESTLWLFDLLEVEDFVSQPSRARPRPQLLLKMASSSGNDPISQIRWAADSQSIAFLGCRGTPERRLFVLHIKDGELKEVSRPGQDVTAYAVAEKAIVYTAARPTDESQLYQSAGSSLPDIQIGTGSSLEMLLFPEQAKQSLGLQPEQLWKVNDGKPQPVIDASTGSPVSVVNNQVLSISPDGRYAIVTGFASRVPREWEQYEPAIAKMHFAADPPGVTAKITTYRPQRYLVIDLHTGQARSVLDAPVGWSAGYFEDALKVAWLDSPNQIVVSNTFLPIVGPEGSRHLRPCVTWVDLETHEVQCIQEQAKSGKPNGALEDLEWDSADQLLLVRHSDEGGDETGSADAFRRDGHVWMKTAAAIGSPGTKSAAAISVKVRQGINTPPRLMASDKRTGATVEFWDPNPQLAEISLGEASVYHWRDAAGHQWTGGLVKPPDFVRGRGYPLVIQTHGLNEDEFLVDGVSTTASAARALAARGIMVLQVREISAARRTPREADVDGRDGYRAAIAQLAREGLVDPARVGIIGWSRTGWYVLESLITEPRLFAAATLAESTHGDLTQYWWLVDYALGPILATSIADGIGGPPSGTGLQRWIARSPEFNASSIRAPVLFEQNSPSALIFGWDIYAALRAQNKPVELLYIRNGDHTVTKPRERLASQEMNVDWYDFWLNYHEDPDPAKAEQYERWRNLRARQERKEQVRKPRVR